MKFKSPDELKNVIETIFKVRKERGWGYKKIAKFIGTHHNFIKRVLRFSSPDEAYKHYLKYHFPEEAKEIEEEEEKEEETKETEDKTEESVSRSANRKILDEVRKYVRNLAVEQLKRILEQGMVVDMLYNEIIKARQEKFKKLFVEEAVKREILNEALVYYLAGKINREKLARVVLATLLT